MSCIQTAEKRRTDELVRKFGPQVIYDQQIRLEYIVAVDQFILGAAAESGVGTCIKEIRCRSISVNSSSFFALKNFINEIKCSLDIILDIRILVFNCK